MYGLEVFDEKGNLTLSGEAPVLCRMHEFSLAPKGSRRISKSTGMRYWVAVSYGDYVGSGYDINPVAVVDETSSTLTVTNKSPRASIYVYIGAY